MASAARRACTRRRRDLTDDDINHELNDSEIDFDDFVSDDDPEYTVPRTARDTESSSCSSSDVEEDHAVVVPASPPILDVEPASPAISDSSLVRSTSRPCNVRGRGTSRRGTSQPGRSLRRGRGASRRGNSQQGVSHDADIPDNWNGRLLNSEVGDLMQPAYLHKDSSDWEWHIYYNQYIDDEILTAMVDSTNRTSILLKGRSLCLSLKELKVYLGITMIMSALQYPHIDMYWSKKWRVSIIVQAMTRSRFYTIRTSLKCVYDEEVTAEQKQDKIWKIRPLFDRILKGCLEQDRPTSLCIDEMIIPFTGRCPMRQYCPNKPNPVGLKVFVLATPQGIVCDMIVYQGETTFPHLTSNGFGLGEAAVLHLTNTLAPGHYLFFDRYFTSVKLCDELLRRGFNGTGTIQKNRVPRDCLLTAEKDFIKKARGTSEVKIRNDGKMATTRWLDKKPVLMLSTCYCDQSHDDCERWSKQKRCYENVRRPEVIKLYNENMGSVDLTDRMLAVCPSRSRTNKWTIRVISHLVDLAVVNAWLCYREDQVKKGRGKRQIEQLREYKLNLGERIVEENDMSTDDESDPDQVQELMPKHKKRKVLIVPIPTKERRQQKAAHLPEYGSKQNRCRKGGCDKKTTVYCKKCKLFLCFTPNRNCFTSFHENENS